MLVRPPAVHQQRRQPQDPRKGRAEMSSLQRFPGGLQEGPRPNGQPRDPREGRADMGGLRMFPKGFQGLRPDGDPRGPRL